MAHRMIANEMSFLRHALHKFGISADEIVQHKKCSRRIVLFQRVKHSLHISVFISRIKRKINDLFLGIVPYKSRLVFFYEFHIRFRLRTLMIFSAHAIPAAASGKKSICQKQGGKRA